MVLNLPAPAKKGLVSRFTKPKSTKRGDDSSETYSNIVPYEGGLPPIGKPKPVAPQPSMDAPLTSRTQGSKRKTSPPSSSATTKRRANPEPLSIYHPTSEEVFATIGTPMEGFFDGVDIMAEAMTSTPATAQGVPVAPRPSTDAPPSSKTRGSKRKTSLPPSSATTERRAMAFTPAVAQGVPAKVPIPSPKPGPVEESAQTERVGESTSILTEIPTPQKRVTSIGASQSSSASPATPLVISASDPFVALSQAVKNGSSMVVTPSSIPSFGTYGPDANLSSDEAFEEILEDFEDKPITKKKVFDSDEDDGGEHKTEVMGPTPVEVPPSSRFEVRNSFAIVPDPVSEATAFFIHFDQPETNNLDPTDFWGARPPYVDFHGFRVLGDCISHLEVVYNSRGDFIGVSFWPIHEGALPQVIGERDEQY
ncbi:hypothetical protein SO802_017718 [Lithocarpus litseifolius]|uniref:Uncharacterized protein n=1 Tax=Lithocarpus litseifolius TaxID=425828 RepID=A0AAW2CNN2_9ROSI